MIEKLIALLANCGVNHRRTVANYLIANDVTIQKHGKNLEGRNSSLFKCSLCGWVDTDTWRSTDEFIFCPGCGAKMDGESC